ncbi:hypothetical protein SKAU_G00150380 [Synaphobranchus kaupii]|uniref:Gypsy retrotransposon integrase-like protein 1 n=1 Tax=Synaphobranchus kaupii TaxID=118154 RepID=A0A9Q1FV29_SYNKA|nr:hypothetical protein SKAU_G00150380 [Synaphobranchus kaupii]
MASLFEHPKIDWDAADLYQEYERFRSHVGFVFAGPLSELENKAKAGWLGTWIGEQGREIYKTLEWGNGEKEDPAKVLEKFAAYIRPRKNKRIARHSRKVSSVDVESEDSQYEDEEILGINLTQEETPVAMVADDKWRVEINILSQRVDFRIDTGAKCNTLTTNSYQSLMHTGELKRSNKILLSYSNHKMKPVAAVDLPLAYKNHKIRAELEIIDIQQENVLSGKTAEALGLIVRLGSIQNASKVSTVYDASKKQSTHGPVGLEDFPELTRTTGTLPGKYTIKIDPDAKPVVHPVRRQPVALRAKIVEKLNEMVENGHIVKVDQPTEWVSSMVVVTCKDKIRICIDPSDLNVAIKREHYPMRTTEEVVSTMPDAKVFSVLDAKSGFLQIELDEASSFLTTFNTPIGRFRWLRLPFGVKCAPEIFQRIIDQMLEGISGATGIMDDILIAAPTIEEHDRTLREVVERATSYNLKLNFDKCHIRQSTVPYVGHLITADGLKPDPAKTEAVRCMPAPTDREGVRRFLGFVTYLSKFIPNLSEIDAPLRQLTKNDVEFTWDPAQQQAFERLKHLCTHHPVLKYFDVTKPVEIHCDASSFGLGSVLLQDNQPVAFSSRSMNDAETRYAQIEKEMLSIVHACTKFHHFIFGKHVTVYNDHKPLEDIYKKPLLSTPMRIQRMRLSLQWYDIAVKYRRGKDMELPDTLSRAQLPDNTPEAGSIESVSMLNFVSVTDERYAELQECTKEELGLLQQTIQQGWPDDRRDVQTPVQPYWDSRSQLAVSDGIVYKGMRIVVPPTMRKHMLELIHQSHLGMVKSKQRTREVLYWPGMSAEIELMIRNCSKCAEIQNRLPKQPLMPTETPELLFEKVASDLFEFEGKQYVILVDYYSKYIEVSELKDQRSRTTIEALKNQFSRHGIPATLRTDNGPQYSAEEFKEFCKSYGIVHKTSSPHTPHSNGEAERAVQTIKRLWSKAPDKHLALLDYRTTPLESVGLSPAQLLMGRRPRNTLPTARALLEPMNYDPLRVKHQLDKTKHAQKFYHDRKRAGRPRTDLRPGEEVRMQPYPGHQRWTPGVIVQQHDAPRSFVVESGGKTFRRNSQHLRTSTAAANRSRHVWCDDELWHERPETTVPKEQQPPAAPPNSTLHLVDLQHNRRYPSAPHKPQVNSILLDGAES